MDLILKMQYQALKAKGVIEIHGGVKLVLTKMQMEILGALELGFHAMITPCYCHMSTLQQAIVERVNIILSFVKGLMALQCFSFHYIFRKNKNFGEIR